MTMVFKSSEARPMPGRSAGLGAWFRANLFSSVGNSLLSVVLLAVPAQTRVAPPKRRLPATLEEAPMELLAAPLASAATFRVPALSVVTPV